MGALRFDNVSCSVADITFYCSSLEGELNDCEFYNCSFPNLVHIDLSCIKSRVFKNCDMPKLVNHMSDDEDCMTPAEDTDSDSIIGKTFEMVEIKKNPESLTTPDTSLSETRIDIDPDYLPDDDVVNGGCGFFKSIGDFIADGCRKIKNWFSDMANKIKLN